MGIGDWGLGLEGRKRVRVPFEPLESPRVMNARPCKQCPSAHHEPDPEALDLQALPFDERVKHVFACAWNRVALCRGVCDRMGVGQADLDHPLLGRAE